MTYLTREEVEILRSCLGLDHFRRENPSKNYLNVLTPKQMPVVEGLIERGYMVTQKISGMTETTHYKATDAGRVAVLDQPW